MTDSFDSGVAHPARRYNYWLGGKDNFAADRESGDLLAKSYPAARIAARANRAFLGRAVRFLAEEGGVRQFLAVGTGLPTAGNTHEVAQRFAPDSSYLVMSCATTDFLTPELKANWDESLRTGRSDVYPRTRSEFAAFFEGLDLVDPGVVAVSEWRPDPSGAEHPAPVDASIFGAVARKP